MGCGSSCCRFVGQLTVSLKFHLCIKLAAIFHFPFLLTFLLPVLLFQLLVKFLFNFRLACEWARDFGYVCCLRGVCALYLHTFAVAFCWNCAYAAFCFRLCWHSCACRPNQFALHICIISTVPSLPGQARPEQSRAGWLAVCLSLSLSLDQYVHSVLIKCHSPHSSLCITLFSCAKFVSHKCCGKSLVGYSGEGGVRGQEAAACQSGKLHNWATSSNLLNLSISTLHA